MKIAGSTMQMAAAANYTGYRNDGTSISAVRTGMASSMRETTEDYDPAEHDRLFGDLFAGYTRNGGYADDGGMKAGTVQSSSGGVQAGGSGFRNTLLSLLFGRFFRAGIFGGVTAAGMPMTGGTRFATEYTRVNSYEYEELSFRAAGCAVTEDGRSISFDMNIFMSRTFVSYTQMTLPAVASALRDPLVVNVGAAVAKVSDQTFRFDLDADGKEEDVSMLAPGSGFLALDKNGDGVIGDGSELFGAQSGDGFGDLRAYDSDGNGWIDENDDIFEKLRVWYKNGDGEDELIDLKEADIGAIWLGEQETPFSLTGAGNQLNGMMRSTGVFLKESGGVGTIQHVDLAVKNGSGTSLEGAGAVGGENFVSGYGTGERQIVPDVLIVTPKNTEDRAETQEEQETQRSTKSQKEQAKEDAKARREEKKRLNAELAEKARKHREEEEERVEQLFLDRKERRELEAEQVEKARERHRAFEESYEEKIS